MPITFCGRREWRARCAPIALVAFAAMLAAAPAQPATFVVKTLSDAATAPPDSLRWALEQANASPGPHTITFEVSGSIVMVAPLPDWTETLTIDGTGRRITIDGANRFRMFINYTGKGLTLRNLTLTRANCNESSAATPSSSGDCASGGSSAQGAAVFASGPLRIENTTITGNQGEYGIVSLAQQTGDTSVPASLLNSTIANNRSASSGAVAVTGGRLNIVNSTLSGHTDPAGTPAASLFIAGRGSARLSNTVFSGPGCGNANAPEDLIDAGGNLAEDMSCAFTQSSSLQGTLAQLFPLGDNGGDTFTMKPRTGSPAIDQGVNALAVAAPGTAALSTDQRGLPRISPSGGRVDRGSVEVQAPATCTAVATPNTLWAPNRKLVDIVVKVTASLGASWTLRSVTSSEPDAGMGRDDLPADIQGWTLGTADAAGRLRAERNGAASRVYTLTYAVSDAAGGAGSCQALIQVPANQRR